jgi:hypothetical protein
MHKQFYFLSPVEVVKVTPQNMEEVAEWCGGKVAQVENKRKPGEMTKFVWVPTPKSSPMPNAYSGMYVTKRVVITVDNQIKTTFSVFRRDYIDKNYFDTPALAVDATWERMAKEERIKAKPVPQAPKKKEPVVPIEKLMGEHGSQDAAPEPERDTVKNVFIQVNADTKSAEQKLQEAIEAVQKLDPNLLIISEEDLKKATEEVLTEMDNEVPKVENYTFIQNNGVVEKIDEDTLQENLEAVAKGKMSVNAAREAMGLPKENLGGLYDDGLDRAAKADVTQFELEYGDDPDLAKRMLVDPFKAPEQQAAARQYLKAKGYHESVWNKRVESNEPAGS